MKQLIRTFSLGLMTATLIAGATYLYFPESTSQEPEALSSKEMIMQLENEGYHVLDEDEYTAHTKAVEKKAEESSENEQPASITSYAIDIVSGSTSPDISQKLEKANIIESASEFDQFMKEKEYSRYIQIGQVTLTSDMSYEEIAEAITSK